MPPRHVPSNHIRAFARTNLLLLLWGAPACDPGTSVDDVDVGVDDDLDVDVPAGAKADGLEPEPEPEQVFYLRIPSMDDPFGEINDPLPGPLAMPHVERVRCRLSTSYGVQKVACHRGVGATRKFEPEALVRADGTFHINTPFDSRIDDAHMELRGKIEPDGSVIVTRYRYLGVDRCHQAGPCDPARTWTPSANIKAIMVAVTELGFDCEDALDDPNVIDNKIQHTCIECEECPACYREAAICEDDQPPGVGAAVHSCVQNRREFDVVDISQRCGPAWPEEASYHCDFWSFRVCLEPEAGSGHGLPDDVALRVEEGSRCPYNYYKFSSCEGTSVCVHNDVSSHLSGGVCQPGHHRGVTRYCYGTKTYVCIEDA